MAERSVNKCEELEKKVSYTEVVKDQRSKEGLTKEVIKVIKEKENLVRDTVDKKKSIMILGLEESEIKNWYKREAEQRKTARLVMSVINEGHTKLEDEIEEVYRIGKYDQGKSRPLKVKLKSQTAAEETLANGWKLAKSNEFKQVWIRREMNGEERKKLNELRSEAKERNEQRTQEEKELFFWRVMDLRLRKWYMRRVKGAEAQL